MLASTWAFTYHSDFSISYSFAFPGRASQQTHQPAVSAMCADERPSATAISITEEKGGHFTLLAGKSGATSSRVSSFCGIILGRHHQHRPLTSYLV